MIQQNRQRWQWGMFMVLFALSVSGQTTVQIGTLGSGSRYLPIDAYYDYSYSQSIYDASEISASGGNSGTINKIRFYYMGSGLNFANAASWDIYMGMTSKTTFSSTTDWVPVAQLTQVFSGNVTFSNTPTVGWLEITLSTPFAYTAGNNLVVAVDENTPDYINGAVHWANTFASSNRSIYYYADGTNPDPASPPSGTTTDLYSSIQFDMGSVAATCSDTPVPGNTVASNTVICTGGTSTLSLQNAYQGISGIAYSWQVNTGNGWTTIANATNSNYTVPATATSASYQAVVTCSAATNSGTSTPIHVHRSNPVVNLGRDTAICPDATLELNAGNPASTYSWSNGLGTAQTAIVTQPGTYAATVTTADNCVATGSIQVTQAAVPSASGLQATLIGGNGFSYQFSILNPQNTTGALWDYDDGGMRTNGPPITSHTYTASGTYMVIAIIFNAQGCKSFVSTEITVSTSTAAACSGTPAPGNTIASHTVLCPGSTATLSIQNSYQGVLGISYTWIENTGSGWIGIPNATSSTYQIPASVGSASYQAMVTCSTSIGTSTPIHVRRSNPVVSLGRDTTICSNASLVLNAGNPASTYSWNNGLGTAQTATVTQPGTYAATVTTTDNCIATGSIQVTQAAAPNASGIQSTLTSGNGLSYQFSILNPQNAGTVDWSYGDGSTMANGPLTISHTYTASGTYTVMAVLSNTAGCKATITKVVIVSTVTGVEESGISSGLSLFPNPASSNVTVTAKEQMIREVTVYDIAGKLVQRIHAASATVSLDVSLFESGVYTFEIRTDKGQGHKRLIISQQ